MDTRNLACRYLDIKSFLPSWDLMSATVRLMLHPSANERKPHHIAAK
jgi:hypothetical protein